MNNPLLKILAFDLETATPFLDGTWDANNPSSLGISCAATLASPSLPPNIMFPREPSSVTGSNTTSIPAPRMDTLGAQSLVRYLMRQRDLLGYKVVTWNGLGFDFPVLAREASMLRQCQALALNHVDMMFQFFCQTGYLVSLDAVARGMGLPGKTQGSGKDMPDLWARGEYQKVLDHVAEDVAITLEVAHRCQGKGQISWITKRGSKSTMPLEGGWLTVEQAMKLPDPDTSWMTNPLPRSNFTTWLNYVEEK